MKSKNIVFNFRSRYVFRFLFAILGIFLIVQIYFLLSTSSLKENNSSSIDNNIQNNNKNNTVDELLKKLQDAEDAFVPSDSEDSDILVVSDNNASHHDKNSKEEEKKNEIPGDVIKKLTTSTIRSHVINRVGGGEGRNRFPRPTETRLSKEEEEELRRISREEKLKINQWIIDEYMIEIDFIPTLPLDYEYASRPYLLDNNVTGSIRKYESGESQEWKLNSTLNRLLLPKPHIFIHIPKTGGSSLGSIFKRNYKKGNFAHYWAHPKNDLIPAILNMEGVFGHIKYGLHFYFQKEKPNFVRELPTPGINKYSYMTMLREPVDRVVSHYYYHRQNKKDPGHLLAMQLSLTEWVEQSPSGSNGQAKMLCGFGVEYTGNLTESIALHHLKYTYKYVGITEMFPESLVMLSHYTGFQNVRYTKINSGRQRVSLSEIPEDIIEEIKRRNQIDIKLYEMAKDIFQKEIDLIGREYFNAEVDQFKQKIGISKKTPTIKVS